MNGQSGRFKLVCNYLDELDLIKGVAPRRLDEKHRFFLNVSEDAHTDWIDIFGGRDGKELIGFLLMGRSPNCHPDADYYIEEAYVVPTYRRQGFMSSVVADYVGAHPGVYCLFILNNNHRAFQFWHHIFGRLGYVPCFLQDVGAGDQYCMQYGFRLPF